MSFLTCYAVVILVFRRYAMLTGRAPFRVADPVDPSFAVLLRDGFYPWPNTFSHPAQHLLHAVLCVDPAGRPSVADILNSEWCNILSF